MQENSILKKQKIIDTKGGINRPTHNEREDKNYERN